MKNVKFLEISGVVTIAVAIMIALISLLTNAFVSILVVSAIFSCVMTSLTMKSNDSILNILTHKLVNYASNFVNSKKINQ